MLIVLCKLHVSTYFTSVSLFRGDRSGEINLHRQHVFYTVMLWKGTQVPRGLGNIRKRRKEEAVKRAIKESEIFVSWIFYNFFLFIFFSQLLFVIIFPILFVPTTFTHTHDPRPTAFSYTRSGLARQGWSGLVGLGLIKTCRIGLIWQRTGWTELVGVG